MAAAVNVLGRGHLARYGGSGTSATSKFEEELAATVGTTHALAVNSGTSALVCALVAAGVGPGDEVLVPAYTWVATAAAPLAVGAVPVLVEIDESLTMDLDDLRAKITPHSKAIIPVHMINLVADMDAICALGEEHGLIVIEDACQAIGVTYRGRRTGSIGHLGAFSFNQHKNIKAGEGGALVTSDARMFARAGMYHDVGSYSREGKFESDEPLFFGMNFRMPEISAAILRPQLKRLDRQMEQRSERRRAIVGELAGRSSVRISRHHDEEAAIGLAIQFDSAAEAARGAEVRGVNRLIDTGRHIYENWQSVVQQRSFHPAMDPFKWASRTMDYGPGSCPATIDVLERTCSVSVDPNVPIALIKRLVRALPS